MTNFDPTVAKWLQDPEFISLPKERRAGIISNYFSQQVAKDKEFQAIPPERQELVRKNFTNTHLEAVPDSVGYDRGFLGDAASRLARGGLNLLEGVAGGMRMMDGPNVDESEVARSGKRLADYVERTRGEHDIFKPDLGEVQGKEGIVKRGFGGALESVPLSLGPLAGTYAGAKGGAVLGGALGGPPGAAVGAVLGGTIVGLGTMFGTFFLGEYQNTYDEAKKELSKQGLPQEEIDRKAGSHALVSATAEFGGELLSDFAALTFFGVIGKRAVKQTVSQTVRELLGDGKKNFVKAVAKSMPFEVGSELGTAYVQASSAQRIGIPGMDPAEAMAESVLPSVFMSLMLGGSIHGMNAVEARRVTADLNSNDPATRSQAADIIGKRIKGKEEQKAWFDTAQSFIDSGKEIPISKPITDFAVQKEAEDVSPADKIRADLQSGEVTPEIIEGILPEIPEEYRADVEKVLSEFKNKSKDSLSGQHPEHEGAIMEAEINQQRAAAGLPQLKPSVDRVLAGQVGRQNDLDRKWGEREAQIERLPQLWEGLGDLQTPPPTFPTAPTGEVPGMAVDQEQQQAEVQRIGLKRTMDKLFPIWDRLSPEEQQRQVDLIVQEAMEKPQPQAVPIQPPQADVAPAQTEPSGAAPAEAEGEQYSFPADEERGAPWSALSPEDRLAAVQKALPGATVEELEGGYGVTTKSGLKIVVVPDMDIKVDKESAERAYGREIGEGDKATGAFQIIDKTGAVSLAKEADTGTLDHEVYHAAEEMVLTEQEVAALQKKYGNAEGRAEAYRKWNGRDRNTLFEKIRDFFSRIIHSIVPTAKSTMREISSGRVWERTGKKEAPSSLRASSDRSQAVGSSPKPVTPTIPSTSPWGQAQYQIVKTEKKVRIRDGVEDSRVYEVSIYPKELAGIKDKKGKIEIKTLDDARGVNANPERIKDWKEIYDSAKPMDKFGDVKKVNKDGKLADVPVVSLTKGCQRTRTTVERVENGVLPNETRVEACYGGDCWVNRQFNSKFGTFENMEVRDLQLANKEKIDSWLKNKKTQDWLNDAIFIRQGQQGDDSHLFASGVALEWLKAVKKHGIKPKTVFITASYAPVTDAQYKELAPYKDQFEIHFSNSGWFHKNEIMIRLAEFQAAKDAGLNVSIRLVTNQDKVSGIEMVNESFIRKQMEDMGVQQHEVLETPFHDDAIKKKNAQKRSNPTGDFKYICCETGYCKSCGVKCMTKVPGHASVNASFTRTDIADGPVGDKDTPRFSRRNRQTQTKAFKDWFGDSVVTVDGKLGSEPLVVYHGTDSKDFSVFDTPAYFSENRSEASAYGRASDMETHSKLSAAGPRVVLSKSPRDVVGSRVEYIGILSDIPVGDKSVYHTDQGVGRRVGNGKFEVFSDVIGEYDHKTGKSKIVTGKSKDAIETADSSLEFYNESLSRLDATGGRTYPVYLSIKNPVDLTNRVLEGNRFGRRLGYSRDEISKLKDKYAAQGYDGAITYSDDPGAPTATKQWIAFEPTQIKSAIGNRGTFDPTDPRITFDRRNRAIDPGGAPVAYPERRGSWVRLSPSDRRKAAQRVVDRLASSWGNAPSIVLLNSQADLPKPVANYLRSIGAETDIVDGVFFNGTVYLVSENLISPFHTFRTVIHEVTGHYGIRGTLGADLDTTLDGIYKSQKDKIADVAKSYKLDLTTQEGRMEATEEWLAREAESNPKSGPVNRMIAAIRKLLRKIFPNLSFSNGDIRALIADARRYVEGGRGTTEGRTSFSKDKMADQWYSQLQKTLEAKLPGTGTPAQIKQMVAAWEKKGEFKSDELAWVGLNDWLDTQEGKVTKQEVLDFVAANNVQLVEVTKGDKPIPSDWEMISSGEDDGRNVSAYRDAEGRIHYIDDSEVSDTKFSQYQEPGGESYREVLLTLPVIPSTAARERVDRYNQTLNEKYGTTGHFGPPRSMLTEAEKKEQGRLARLQVREVSKGNADVFRSSHWDESNVLVHVRLNDRTGPNGEKILFVEEVQSDWHQKGRKEGYARDLSLDDMDIEILPWEQAAVKVGEPLGDIVKDHIAPYRRENNIPMDAPVIIHKLKNEPDSDYGVYYGAPLSKAAFLEQHIKTQTDPWSTYGREIKKRKAGVPNAPFKGSKNWSMLAMKRLVRMAAEQGYDSVSWTPGTVHTGRWGTERIEWQKQSDGSFLIDAKAQSGGIAGDINLEAEATARGLNPQTAQSVTSEKELRDAIDPVLTEGQDADGLAKKLWDRMQGEDSGVSMPRKEGFEGFYDKILPAEVNKFFNKAAWGKARVGATQIRTSGFAEDFQVMRNENGYGWGLYDDVSGRWSDEVFTSPEAAREALDKIIADDKRRGYVQSEVWNLPITPEMRQKALREGMPLFKRAESTDPNHQAAKDFNKEYPGYSVEYDGIQEGYGSIKDRFQFTIREGIAENATFTSATADMAGIKEGVDRMVGMREKVKPKFSRTPKPNPYLEKYFPKGKLKLDEKDYEENRRLNQGAKAKATTNLRMVLEEMGETADKYLGAISTRLGNINMKLKDKLRKLDYDMGTKSAKDMIAVHAMLKKAKNSMSRADFTDWDYARKNSDKEKIDQLIEKYDLRKEYDAHRDTLDRIREEALDVGMDVGMIEDYAPRILKDQKGFLRHLQRGKDWDIYSRALKERAEKLGLKVHELTDDMKADIISNMIISGFTGLGGVPFTKSRKIDLIPPELNRYYMHSDAALVAYIHQMRKHIEIRKFFGKVPDKITEAKKRVTLAKQKLKELQESGASEEKIKDVKDDIKDYNADIERYKTQRDYTENIGGYIIELMENGDIRPDQEKTVHEILHARFHERGAVGMWAGYKNLSYIDTMGSPISALTQIGDLAWSAYDSGIIRTLKNVSKAVRGKSRITKEDVGIERMAQEFADSGSLASAVNKVFSIVQLDRIDSIGKEALLNGAFDKYQAQAKKNPEKLKKEIRRIFGKETEQVVKDFADGTVNDNTKLLVYSRLLDFQPVSKSEMTQGYLTAGNGRLFYMLKTFTLKQFDAFRNEAYNKIKNGDRMEKLQGIKSLVHLAMFFVLANATADELKDWVLGRETSFKDRTIDNALRLLGVSKFITWEARKEGIGTAMGKQILPPFKFINNLYKDLTKDDVKVPKTIESVPVVGKIAYWHMKENVD